MPWTWTTPVDSQQEIQQHQKTKGTIQELLRMSLPLKEKQELVDDLKTVETRIAELTANKDTRQTLETQETT
jgi:hypothetical protein